jgi:hypothetical protein
MSDLEKRISGDWIDIKATLNDPFGIQDLLKLSLTELKTAAERLRFSVEQGIIEFKRSVLSPVLSVLETARFKTLETQEIADQERALTQLLFVVLLQRLLALEIVPLARGPEGKRDFGIADMQVNVILSDVNSRMKADPSLRARSEFKNILMQVQLYKKENQKLRELLPTIKPEMRTAFLGNFTKTFAEIIASIRRQYLSILEEEAEADKARQAGFSLANLPLKELAPLLTDQAKEFSRVRSTLAHARDEKYKTRETLVRLYDQRQEAIRLIEQEAKSYVRVCRDFAAVGSETCVTRMADGFRSELVILLEKQLKRDSPPGNPSGRPG